MVDASGDRTGRICGRNWRDALGSGILQEAFSCAGLNWQNHVEIDSNYYRPAEVNLLIGDASKAKESGLGAQDTIL